MTAGVRAPTRARSFLRSLRDGLLIGGALGLFQGIVESSVLLVRFRGVIFRPEDRIEVQLFSLLERLGLVVPGAISRLVLDSYLGLSVAAKLPLIPALAGIYGVLGLIAGAVIGTSEGFCRRCGLRFDPALGRRLSVALAAVFGINLLIWMNARDVVPTFTLPGVVVNLALIGCSVGVMGWLEPSLDALERWAGARAPRYLGPEAGRSALVIVILAIVGCWLSGAWAGAIASASVKPAYTMMEASAEPETVDSLERGPNVILISIDSLRADHLGAYGYDRATSPNIDSLARAGVRFDRAFSNTSWTLPSHATLFTSMYSDSHGVTGPWDALGEDRVTLAETLQSRGFRTAAFVSGPFLQSSFGLGQGFDLYDDETILFRDHSDSHRGVTSPRLTDAVTKWLEANASERFFLFVHYWDVHYDYAPPAPFDTVFDPDYRGTMSADFFESNPNIYSEMDPRDREHVIALYDGEIAFTDRHLGKLLRELDRLGLTERTLVVLTADHGDEFFEHGQKGHYKSLYDEVLRVPLIFRFPEEDSGQMPRTVDRNVGLIDVAPTILSYLGIPAPETFQGRDIMPTPTVNGRAGEKMERPLFARLERRYVAVRTSRLKIVHGFRPHRLEVFDLGTDPQEQHDLALSGLVPSEDFRFATRELLRWMNAQHRTRRASSIVPSADDVPATIENELRSLGYIR